jgi:hypothetical protein
MIIDDEIINVSAKPGEVFHEAVKDAVEFCVKYDCAVRMKFNGVIFIITKHTDI